MKDLNGLPLAIEQAGSLLSRQIVSLSTFAEQYRARYLTLMGTPLAKGVFRYEKHRSIVTVFDMLYTQVKMQDPKAAVLLAFCSVLSPWVIPLTFLKSVNVSGNIDIQRSGLVDDETSILTKTLQNDLDLRLAIDTLTDACLLKMQTNPKISESKISVHGAICQWILKTQEKTQEWTLCASETLVAELRNPIFR